MSLKFFDKWTNTKVYEDRLSIEINEEISAILQKHNISNDDLKNDLVQFSYHGMDNMISSIKDIGNGLLNVDRYHNMKAFPIVVDICKKGANKASTAIGWRVPFPDHYSAQ